MLINENVAGVQFDFESQQTNFQSSSANFQKFREIFRAYLIKKILKR